MICCTNLFSQTPTWSESIASIIYNNCSSCHHDGGIAPFALMSYVDAVDNHHEILDAVIEKEMPPWPADPEYRHFKDEAVLSEDEINLITEWINNEAPEGDPDLAPAPPEFIDSGSLLDTIDFTVQIEPYTLQYDEDEYRYFVIHTDFTETVYVNKIEVFAGLPSIVHHADIYYDESDESATLDLLDPLSGFNGNTGYPSVDYYMNAWQPGGNIASYPDNWGIEVPPGVDFVVEIHYGPGGIGLIDSTKMHLQFIKDPGDDVRPVYVGWLLNGPATGSLIIPANEIVTFEQEYTLPVKKSFISICPHMHLLGKSYKVWYEHDGDSVNLINIPQWDFHWQKYYTFQTVQVIPGGAKIKAVATYDNTSGNPENPNDPPITIYNGPTTKDEMLMTYFIYTNYKSGDEDIILDSTYVNSVFNYEDAEAGTFNVYPNPATDNFIIHGNLFNETTVSIRLINSSGQVLQKKNILENVSAINENMNIKNYPAGVYFIDIISQQGRSRIMFEKI
ncbi:MAG: T9SS type A sorting domain-containing protein [Fimbriimonadaceae bacterium]|nr:T9SS type A sorting domain-containing protein [Chitinophagales bacterium]